MARVLISDHFLELDESYRLLPLSRRRLLDPLLDRRSFLDFF